MRVLALASKEIKTAVNERREAESNLEFLGFLTFQSELKAATNDSLAELHRAQIRTIMATGDNLQTGIAIGKECSIIKPDD